MIFTVLTHFDPSTPPECRSIKRKIKNNKIKGMLKLVDKLLLSRSGNYSLRVRLSLPLNSLNFNITGPNLSNLLIYFIYCLTYIDKMTKTSRKGVNNSLTISWNGIQNKKKILIYLIRIIFSLILNFNPTPPSILQKRCWKSNKTKFL